ncbi:hypothetical protein PRK78_004687 [Emydomyces testavorans]|uniref:Uncharacterized protein n=1 Tax=Emydomyces testavorans TaxID=2070801 RepID=A0AAF0IJF8_9EURO|nr:hypothetical protein PRK78_004687 [Emydomyces testavorans]
MKGTGSLADWQAGITTDVGAIWKTAIARYEDIAMVKITSLASARNVNDIVRELQERETRFKSRRHDGSKMDKFRSLVCKSLKPIERVCEAVMQAGLSSQTANSVSADYDKVVSFFEDVSSYLNTLKILETQVPPIPELRDALAEVLASVLILCGIFAKYLKMKRVVKAFRSLGFGEDDELAAAHEHFRKMVQQEEGVVRNATLAAVEKLRKDTDQKSTMILAGTERVYSYLKGQEPGREKHERDSILKGLSSLSFDEKQRDKFAEYRHGTRDRVLHSHEFQKWFQGTQNGTLWLSIAVNYVSETTRGTKSAIVYIYCDYKDEKTQSELQLLSSISRQLAEQSHPIPPEVIEFREKNAEKKRNPTADEWIFFIRSLCLAFQSIYIFVDALDECPETNRNTFLRLLKSLEPFVRFLFTSRPNVISPVEFMHMDRIEISTIKSDIETYLESEIDRNDRLARFVTKDPKLKVDIIEGVNEKAAGMFLLACFQIKSLCKQNSLRGVRKAIKALPMGIYETYEAAIHRIEKEGEENCETVKRALSYIYCARRPLTVEELLHALAVEPNDTGLDEDAAPETDFLLSASAGLIRIDEKRSIIGLVHHTLQEYFDANPEKLLPEPEAEFGKICLSYLSFDVFKEGPCTDGETLNKRLQDYRFLDYASHNWGHHVMSMHIDEQTNLIVPYLEDSAKLSSSVQVLHLTPSRKKDWYNRFPNRFGPLHAAAYWNLEHIMSNFLESGVDVNSQDSHGATALHVASKQGHTKVVELLLNEGTDIDIQNESGETALYWAARNGQEETVGLLLLNGAKVLPDNEGWNALSWAIVGGHIEVVKVLLDQSADLDVQHDGRHKALYLAAEEGHDKIVQVLLDNGVDVNAQDHLKSTALDFAVAAGHETAVRALLRNGAAVNLKDIYDNSALHWAVLYETIMRLLLEHGADAQAQNDCEQTALCWAAQGGSVAVARMLIEANADVNTRDRLGLTPLHRAALRGCKAMVELLLEYGADPNLKDQDDWTPLHGACLQQHEAVVQILLDEVDNGRAILEWAILLQGNEKKKGLLAKRIAKKMEGSTVLTGLREAAQETQVGRLRVILEKGADIDAKDPGGWTALAVAAFEGSQEAVQLLLEEGAKVNIRGSDQWTPLWYAIDRGHEAAMSLLIEYGADVNASAFGTTPLMLAVEKQSMAMVETLIRVGADLNAQDYRGQTALHMAALLGLEEIMLLLARKGADLNVRNDMGKTALMLAVENQEQTIVKLLLGIGADVQEEAEWCAVESSDEDDNSEVGTGQYLAQLLLDLIPEQTLICPEANAKHGLAAALQYNSFYASLLKMPMRRPSNLD